MPPIELISGFIGLVLTLLIFSYLIGDNPLFRSAVYIFIGTSSGYAAVIFWYDVLLPKLSVLRADNPSQFVLGLIPFLFGATLLAKPFPRIAWLGSFAMALLVGVGAATALSGAVIGTLIPQSEVGRDWQASTRFFARSRSERPGASGRSDDTCPSRSSTLQVPQDPALHS